MVRTGDHAVLMDFGLAKFADAEALTRQGHALGSPMYMAPEILKGVAPSAASDLWAAGLVLYEMLSRRRPFLARSFPEIIQNVLYSEPTSLVDVQPGLPRSADD